MRKYGNKRRLAAALAISMIINVPGTSLFGTNPNGLPGVGFISMAQQTASVATPDNAQKPDDGILPPDDFQKPDNEAEMPDAALPFDPDSQGNSSGTGSGTDHGDSPVISSPSNAFIKVTGLELAEGTEAWVIVEPGTPESMISLPETVLAQTETDGFEEAEEITDISWSCRNIYNPDTPGVYDFTPRLPKEYRIKEGVTVPVVHVCVGDNLITAINLPDEEQYIQAISGTSEKELGLPNTIDAVLCGTQDIPLPVTWHCEEDYLPEQDGLYIFKAAPEEEYLMAAGVEIPVIMVMVGESVLLSDSGTVEPKITVVPSAGNAAKYMWRNDITINVTLNTEPAITFTGAVGLIKVILTDNAGKELLNSGEIPINLKEKTPVVFQDPKILTPDDENYYYINVTFTPIGNSPVRQASLNRTAYFSVKKADLQLGPKAQLIAEGEFENTLGDIKFAECQVIIKDSDKNLEKLGNINGHWEWNYKAEELNAIIPPVESTPAYKAIFILDSSVEHPEYYTELAKEVIPKIKPKQLWFTTPPVLKQKYYTGSPDGEATTIYVRRSESGEQEILPANYYETPTVTYNNADAGEGRTATVKITLTNKNYCFDSKGSLSATQIVSNLRILPNNSKPIINIPENTYQIYVGDRSVDYQVTLFNAKNPSSAQFNLLVPTGMKGTLGTVTTKHTVATQNAVKDLTMNESGCILNFRNITTAKVGAKDEVTITFYSSNFQPVTAKLYIEVIDQKKPLIRDNKIQVKGTLKSRQKVGSNIKPSGTLIDPNTNKTIVTAEEEWGWVKPDESYSAGAHNLEWIWTPSGKLLNEYAPITGFVEVTVVQSEASLDPSYSDNIRTEKQVYPYGTTLDEIKIVDGNNSTERWIWQYNSSTKPTTAPKRGSTKYAVEFIPSDPVDFTKTSKTLTVSIEQSVAEMENGPPKVSGVYGSKITDYKFDDTTGFVSSSGNRLNGKWVWDTENMDTSSIPDVNGTTTYPAVFKITPYPDYYTEVRANIIPEVAPRNIQEISNVTLKTKTYDGTTVGTAETITCKTSDNKTVKLTPEDYKATVTYDNYDAGKGRMAMISITSNTKNYTFLPEDGVLHYEVKNAVIEKSTARPDVLPSSLTCYAAMDEKKSLKTTFDLNQFVPIAKPGQTTGAITYTVSPVTTTVGKYTVDKKGTLTITAQKWEGIAPEDKVRVYVNTENYQQAYVDLYVKGTGKQVPVQSEPMTFKSILGAGQPLSRLILDQGVVFLDSEGSRIPGTISWVNPAQTFEAGTYSAEWIFTPEDQEKFMPVTGSVTFTVIESSFSVTVTGGSGGGSYAEGAIVELQALLPEQHIFTGWTSPQPIDFADPASANTTFIMPRYNVTIEAHSEYRPSFAVTVIDGEGSGTYMVGEKVSISAIAPSARYQFTGWTAEPGVVFEDAASKETTFIMPEAAVTVTANFSNGSGGGGGPVTAGNTPYSVLNLTDANGISLGRWCSDAHGWWFRIPDGTYALNDWKYVPASDGKTYWYYLDGAGYMVTGWLALGPYVYYFDNTPGVTLGSMATGWKQIDGKWYFFDTTEGASYGAMLRNVTTSDGHRLGADGAWIP
ncbi:InlB B-repeat-containing protein [Hungatella hathewayi]|uniref:InlB B-repeat-containing protein n=1 Tax=Hungatella hathewayi TaxID=154046 RepID=UPI003563E27E